MKPVPYIYTVVVLLLTRLPGQPLQVLQQPPQVLQFPPQITDFPALLSRSIPRMISVTITRRIISTSTVPITPFIILSSFLLKALRYAVFFILISSF